MVNEKDIRKSILEALYLEYFTEDGDKNIDKIRIQLGVDLTLFENIVDKMSYESLIEAWTAGYNYTIKIQGIMWSENEGIPSNDLVTKNKRIRTLVLDRLANVHEHQGNFGGLDISTLAKELGFSVQEVANNLQFLDDCGYVEHFAASLYKITYDGLESVEEWRKKVSLSEMLEEIKGLSPQIRGIKFQTLLSNVLARDGWQSEVSVKTEYEEMDILFSKRREYYLVECKWEKERIEAGVIRELFGKISNRVGIHGILFSMSGFTSGAKKQARNYAPQKIILFFGPKDIVSLIQGGMEFDIMLDEKYKAYVTRTMVEFS